MSYLVLLISVFMFSAMAHAQSGTGNIVSASNHARDVTRNSEYYTTPEVPEGFSSCRIWIRGNFLDDNTLFDVKVNKALLEKGYYPLQRGTHRIKFVRTGSSATVGTFMSYSISYSFEDRFTYNWDHPSPGDLLMTLGSEDLRSKPFLGRLPVRITGSLGRFGEKIVMVDDLSREHPDGKWFLDMGTLMEFSDATSLNHTWSGGVYKQHIFMDSMQINPSSENGYSRKFRKAFLKLIENMPTCQEITPADGKAFSIGAET